MKSRIIRDVKLLGVVVVLVATLFIARYLQLPGVSKANPNKPVTVVTTSQTIIRENALPGTTSWSIPKGLGATTEIQAYASTTSVLPGHTITFYVSTQNDGTAYSIDIYRLGWYGGAGGRLMTSRIRQIGQAQGYYDSQTGARILRLANSSPGELPFLLCEYQDRACRSQLATFLYS